MKFCHQCGKRLDEELAHCPYCGALQESTALAGDKQEANQNEVSENISSPESKSNDTSQESRQKRTSKKPIVAVVGGLVALIAVAGVVAFLLMPPDLSEEKILSDFDSVPMDTTTLSNSSWGGNDGYEETSREVQGIEELDQITREVTVARVYVNNSFR